MAKEKFKVTEQSKSDLGTVIYTTVEMQDDNGVMVEYGIKDYYDEHQGNKIIDTEIENMTTGADVGEYSVIGKKILIALAEVNQYDKLKEKFNDEISPSEKLNNFLADIGIIDEHFEDQIHTLIIHYTKYKKHQQDFEDNYPEGDPAYEAHVNKMNDIPGFEGTLEALDDLVVPCSAKLDNEMYNESI